MVSLAVSPTGALRQRSDSLIALKLVFGSASPKSFSALSPAGVGTKSKLILQQLLRVSSTDLAEAKILRAYSVALDARDL